MGRTGDPQPTRRYPRIKYGSPSTTLEFSDPAHLYSPPQAYVTGDNIALSGAQETLYFRTEDVIRCRFPWISPDEAYAIKKFLDTHGGRGKTFECWLDRFTGSVWLFQDTLTDQNELVLALNSGSASYAATANGKGIDLLAGTQHLSVALAQQSAGSPTGYDDPLDKAEGVVCLDLKPNWAANDGARHDLLDTSGATNRLRLYKTTGNALTFEIVDTAGGAKTKSGTPSWSANARVQIVARWDTAGVLSLWYAVNAGAFTELTSAAGAGTGLLSSLATTLYVGADQAGAGPINAIVDTLAIFKRAFEAALLLANYRPFQRNYVQKGQIRERVYEPLKALNAVDLFTWDTTIRKGQ